MQETDVELDTDPAWISLKARLAVHAVALDIESACSGEHHQSSIGA